MKKISSRKMRPRRTLLLKREYGRAEAIRHYIDLEDYGSSPFANLNPDINAMRQRYGEATLERSGTLPWTIEQVSAAIAQAWRRDDCHAAETLSGYLAHYIGDASQPLHSTRYYDGIGQDRGIHARLEFATDASLAKLAPLARPAIKLIPVTSAWDAAIAEIRRANALIPAITQADRAARAASPPDDHQAYNRALIAQEGRLIAGQIADASSVLASIWLYEWKSAGSPSCLCRRPLGDQRRGASIGKQASAAVWTERRLLHKFPLWIGSLSAMIARHVRRGVMPARISAKSPIS